MNWTTVWVFAITETVLAMTPGPAVLYVLSSALRAGARRSLASTLAILAANATYFAISATSLGTLLVSSYRLFSAVKWIGAAYLIVLGVRSFIGHRKIMPVEGDPDETTASSGKLFRGGFVLQMSNPKAIVFFTAILPQFIDPHRPIALQIIVLGTVTTVCEFIVLACYGLAAGKASNFARQPKYATCTERVSGLLLMGAGTGLALLTKD